MFEKRLYSRNWRIRRADWLCPAAKATGLNRWINWILVSFAQLLLVSIWPDETRIPCTSKGRIPAHALLGDILAFDLHWSWHAQMDSQAESLYRNVGALETTIIRVQIRRRTSCWCKESSRWRFIVAKIYCNRLNYDQSLHTGTANQRLHAPEKGEVKVMYMSNYNVLSYKEAIGLPAVYPIATSTEKKHNKCPTLANNLMHEQAKDSYCPEASSTIGLHGLMSSGDNNGFLVRTLPIYGAVQKFFLTSLPPCLLYHCDHPTLMRHPSERRMYDLMQRECCWPHMANYVYTTVRYCCKCVQNMASEKPQCPLQLVPESRQFRYITLDILRRLPKTLNESQFVLEMKDRYTKLASAVPEFKITASHLLSILMNKWVIPYRISQYVLSNNKTQFTNIFFELLCAFLGTKHLSTTAYHPQMKELNDSITR